MLTLFMIDFIDYFFDLKINIRRTFWKNFFKTILCVRWLFCKQQICTKGTYYSSFNINITAM